MKIDKILSSENIAEDLKKEELDTIGYEVCEGYDADVESRSEWEKRNADAMKLAVQFEEDKSWPWEGASNVKYPLITVACMQYNARAYPALIPNNQVVKHRVIGEDPDGSKRGRALRVSEHMNYQLLHEDEAWEDEMDRLLMSKSLLGTAFKKTYFDPSLGKNISELVTADNFVVDYFTRSLETCRRKTHVIYLAKNEIISRMRMGEYREFDIDEADYKPSKIKEATDQGQGKQAPLQTKYHDFKILEQHCYIDLDDDGYDEPYIVTTLFDTKEVLRIVPGFTEEDITYARDGKRIAKIEQYQYFTKYGFIPSPDGGFYDIGFGILLSPMNHAVNTLINQLIDAGTLSNLQAGFISRGIRVKGGKTQFRPGEWKMAETMGDDLRKGIFPLPVRDPSQVLFQLLGLLIEAGQKIGSVSEMMVGESPGQNQPAQTTLAVLEQGLKVYTAIIKRSYRSLALEFRKLYKLNSLYLDPQTYFEVLDGGNGQVFQMDYMGDPKDISPVADPNIVSDVQRLSKAEAVLGRAAQLPHFYNQYEAERRYLEAIQEDGIDTLLIPEDQIQQPQDPKIALEQEKFRDESERGWTKLEIDMQESIINMRKKEADTERSMMNTQVTGERQDLEVARFLDEAEFKRAELIRDTIIQKRDQRMAEKPDN